MTEREARRVIREFDRRYLSQDQHQPTPDEWAQLEIALETIGYLNDAPWRQRHD